MHRLPRAGDTLELVVEIESCDAESIQYRGRALVDGNLILELSDTLGSMLDIHEFDAPDALRADFDLLTHAGRAPGAFKGVPRPVLEDIPGSTPQRLEAHLSVPAQADFFLDHFPRRPVFPATLCSTLNFSWRSVWPVRRLQGLFASRVLRTSKSEPSQPRARHSRCLPSTLNLARQRPNLL